MRKLWASLAGVLALVPVLSVSAAEPPPLPKGVSEITTPELKRLFDLKEKFTLINSLSGLEFTQTKIKGSVNLPFGHLRDGKAKLPADKAEKLIFYCLGPG